MDGHWGMLGHTSSAWSSRGSSMVSDPLIYHVLKQGWCSETEANWSEKKNISQENSHLPDIKTVQVKIKCCSSMRQNKMLQCHLEECKQQQQQPNKTQKQNKTKQKLFISRNCRIQQSCRCTERETQQLTWIKISFTNKMKSSWKLTHRHGNL